MTRFRAIVILMMISQLGLAQVKVLESLDPEAGRYSLVFVNVEIRDRDEIEVEWPSDGEGHVDPDEYLDERLHYIVEDKQQLTEIANTWIGKPVDYQYLCWYDYFIYLLKDGEVVSEMRANFECKELLVDGAAYEFDSTLITAVFPKAERLYQFEIKFDSLQSGRKRYAELAENNDLVMERFNRPLWMEFDGQFMVQYLQYKKKKQDVRKAIVDRFDPASKSGKFQLTWSGTSLGRRKEPHDHTYRVYCNEDFANSFSGLPVKEEWKPFSPPFKATFLTRSFPVLK